MKILDCTLRDGGYYSNWDFPHETVEKYLKTMSGLPVDYVELGYRTPPQDKYFGKYFYTPIETIKWAKDLLGDTKIALMIDAKSVPLEKVSNLLYECKGLVDLIRITVDPNSSQKIQSAILLAKAIKEMGFQVAFNLMYISTIKDTSPIYSLLNEASTVIDYLYLVDSFGSIFPQDLLKCFQKFSSLSDIPLGFHGHNNIELAFSNTLQAIEGGASIVDGTIMGMGRGAGNLKTELLLSYFHSKREKNIRLTPLSELLELWQPLLHKYQWGTCFPYMVSGMNSLPQKDVMEWMSKRRYSVHAIVRGLQHQCEESTETFPLASEETLELHSSKALLIGGGNSVREHFNALQIFLQKNPFLPIIHLSSRNLSYFEGFTNPQLLCLTGTEGCKLDDRIHGQIFNCIKSYVLPPSPRKMGAYIPEKISPYTKELSHCSIGEQFKDAPQAIACEIAKKIGAQQIYLIGCDGYGSNDYALTKENQTILEAYQNENFNISSLVPTDYANIDECSIYGLITNCDSVPSEKVKYLSRL